MRGITLQSFLLLVLSLQRFIHASSDFITNSEEWGETSCIYKRSNSSVLNIAPDFPSTISVNDSGHSIISHCKFCFTIWKDEENEILSQGCWLSSDGCTEGQCVSQGVPNLASNQDKSEALRFCCCSGDNCNEYLSAKNSSTSDNVDLLLDQVETSKSSFDSSALGLMILFSVAFLLLLAFTLTVNWNRLFRAAKFFEQETDVESCTPSSNSDFTQLVPDLSSLTLEEIIGQGKYGIVYKGRIRTESVSSVAVKVFTQSQKKAFMEERDIYELATLADPSMTSSILKYHGFRQQACINSIYNDSILVLEFAERGSLLSFLKNHTLSWPEMCKMLQNIAQGLTALHSGFQNPGSKPGSRNPSICHRDLNSRNILVRSDLSCCIADFGLSIRLQGSNFFRNGMEQNAETGISADFGALLSLVGTVRYLAPELLDTNLNLCDCEAALKQADIYSLGLVFWELSRRCRDLYQGAAVCDFEQAYERELGCLSPTFDQMKLLVARNRARPLFPEVWKQANPAVRQLIETIQDCWDQDGEARLTAHCTLERITQLPVLWDRYKQSQGPVSTIGELIPNNRDLSDNQKIALDNATTLKLDNVHSGQLPPIKIQPHQGRNLCLERNLLSDDDSESSPLIEKSTKDVSAHRPDIALNETPAETPLRMHGSFRNAIPFVRNDLSASDLRNEKSMLPATSRTLKPKTENASGNVASTNGENMSPSV